jgi:predicted metalloendopeptidase
MMVDVMKGAFRKNLDSLTWLSSTSLKAAEAKLANMVDLVGYPKLVLNATWLDSVYREAEVVDDDYLVRNNL